MAARKRNWIDPKTREKIKTTKIIQRLQMFALGEDDPCYNEKDPDTGQKLTKKVEMSPAQVKAAQILIDKNLPSLTSSDINVTQDMPESKAEIFEQLKAALGEELALKIAPEFAEIPVERVIN